MGIASVSIKEQKSSSTYFFEGLGWVANKTDTLNKTQKVFKAVIQFLQAIPGTVCFAVLNPLLKLLNFSISVFNGTNLLERACDPWSDLMQRWEKAASRISLTVAQVLETISFIDKVTLNFFSQAALCIGSLPIFELVKNSLYGISAIFGICAASKDLKKASEKISKSSQKLSLWQERLRDPQDISQTLLIKYTQKLGNSSSKELSEHIQSVSTTLRHDKIRYNVFKNHDPVEASKLKVAIRDHKEELVRLKTEKVKVKKLEQYSKAILKGNTKKLVDYKIEKYKIIHDNGKKLKQKSWVSIASEISKIVMITLGILIASLASLFPFLTGPVLLLIVSSLGLGTSLIQLGKNLYSDMAPKPAPVPTFQA